MHVTIETINISKSCRYLHINTVVVIYMYDSLHNIFIVKIYHYNKDKNNSPRAYYISIVYSRVTKKTSIMFIYVMNKQQ